MVDKDKNIVDHLEIIATNASLPNPYYEIKYHNIETNEWCIGYSSYSLPIVLAFILEYFIIKRKENNYDSLR